MPPSPRSPELADESERELDELVMTKPEEEADSEDCHDAAATADKSLAYDDRVYSPWISPSPETESAEVMALLHRFLKYWPFSLY